MPNPSFGIGCGRSSLTALCGFAASTRLVLTSRDFVCLEKYLVIEVDGGHHGEPEQMAHDEKRSAWLSAQGYRVIRFWTHEVLYDTENVLSAIFEELKVQPSRERTTPTRCIQWLSSAS